MYDRGDSSKLSPEQIQKLAKTISAATNLTEQQEEIIKKVIAGETEIGNLRISSLEKYFDIYSRNLDLVARKHSALNDTFLILEEKLNNSYKNIASDVAELEQQLASLSKESGSRRDEQSANIARASNAGVGNQSSNYSKHLEIVTELLLENKNLLDSIHKSTVDSTNSRDRILNDLCSFIYEHNYNVDGYSKNNNSAYDGGDQIDQLTDALQAFNDSHNSIISRYVSQQNYTSNGVNASADSTNIIDEDVYQTVEDTARNRLGEARTSENIVQRVKAFEDIEAQTDAIISKQEDAVISLEQLKDARQSARKKQADEYASKETQLEETLTELTMARLQTRADREAKQRDLQISHAQEMAKAELAVEERLNQFKAQSKYNQSEEAAQFSSRETDANQTLGAIGEIEKQKAAFKEQLDKESMSNSIDGTLTPEEAAKNAALVEEQFSNVEERLTALRLKNALEANQHTAKLVEANEKKKAAAIAKYEAAERKKNNGILTAEKRQEIKNLADREFALSKENLDKLAKEEEKKAKKKIVAEDSPVGKIIAEIKSLDEKIIAKDEDKSSATGDAVAKGFAALDSAVSSLSSLAAELDKSIDKIASYQGDIDTRLQGSNNEKSSGSYWSQLTKDMMSVGAITPYFKQEDFANNIKSLVDQGISFDLKQRAFLMTIQEKIANTFNVADGTLLRLIRIQQEDSTAGRLGMESALNSFLNNMYENTEYLKTVADGVRSSLQEMEALMTGTEATEIEYQVQKWMGSLYSVGMSQEAVNSIASALGQLAAGQIDALTNGNGAGNLLVMAANEAGKSISEILAEGLNAEDTNELLQATVNYMAELAESSKDSRVVQQQLASVFGVKASDLKAATNLATNNTVSDIYGNYLTYDNMLNRLNVMAGTMHQRTSLGEMMQNVWDNGLYSLSSSMANNPISYLIYKAAGLLDATTGGISIPAVSVLGNMVDLDTTVADLMRVGSMAGGILGSIGQMVSGLSNSFNGQAMLAEMDIGQGSGLKVTPRGTGNGVGASEMLDSSRQSVSSSGYVGNASGSDIKNSTIQEAEDSKKQHMIEALEEERAHQIDYINANVLKIYELLDEVASGKRNFTVKVAGYGLTSLGSNTSLSSAQGGVNGLLSNAVANSPSNSVSSQNSSGNSGSSGGTGTSTAGWNNSSTGSGMSGGYSIGSGIDLGGWTIM